MIHGYRIIFLEKTHWDKLTEAKYADEEFGQRKNDYDYRGKTYVLLLAPKVKYCLTIEEFEI